eukprot:SM000309S11862  [mRNA]  locus=s309:36004:37306:+ [translate_table: standard]
MAAVATDEAVDIKFRLYDGTDIGPTKFAPATTVQALKESIISQWPSEKAGAPKSVSDLKLINAGKILENTKTLQETRIPAGEFPGVVLTMHVVVRPPSADKVHSAAGGCSKDEQVRGLHNFMKVLANSCSMPPRCGGHHGWQAPAWPTGD